MAKMRYSEMSRDISSDSLFATKFSEDDGCKSKSPNSDADSPCALFNGHDSPLLNCDAELDTHSKHGLSAKPTEKTTFSKTCYENYGSVHSHVGTQAKSQSLPSNATMKTYEQVVLDPLRVPPEDFASQLTLLDLPTFRAITSDELSSCAWNKKNKLIVAPNVVAFTRRFNHVSFWVVQEVLKGSTARHRAEILTHFIRIAKKLYDLNNLHSLFAIISALQSASIYRLNKTWSSLAKKDRQTFDKLSDIFSDKNNWLKLREHMENQKLPCIPYLGLFLTDLTYINMAHPHLGGLESQQRQLKMNNVLRVISDYQRSNYSFLVHLPHIQTYLRSVRYIEELQKFVEDDQYKLSLKLEPPSPAPSSSSSKESVSDVLSVTSLSLSPAKMLHGTSVTPVAKFVPTHRKCHSLSSRFRSTSLPRNFSEVSGRGQAGWKAAGIHSRPSFAESDGVKTRHLLDDSVLEENHFLALRVPPIHSTDKRDSAVADEEGCNLLAVNGSTPSSESEEESESHCTMQGCLRRKTVLKDGKKPAVGSWQRYWIQLWGTSLVYYPLKAFKGSSTRTERSHYKREPCKIVSLVGWTVLPSEDPLHPDVFGLADPHRGNVYKFRAGTAASAEQWCRRLQQVSHGIIDKPLPANLMSFE